MHDVLVVVQGVLLDGLLVIFVCLLPQTGLSMCKFLFLHDVIVGTVDDDGGEELVEVGTKLLRRLTDHLFIL